jgi:hypothetical protein
MQIKISGSLNTTHNKYKYLQSYIQNQIESQRSKYLTLLVAESDGNQNYM